MADSVKETEQKAAAKAFAAKWKGVGDEKQHTQTFWLELLHEVYGVEQPFGFITFEDKVKVTACAVTLSKTALWIAESQALQETKNIIHLNLDFLPLKTNAHIVEGNALRMDWGEVVPREKYTYIIGNPPLDGYNWGHLKNRGSRQSSSVKNRKHVDATRASQACGLCYLDGYGLAISASHIFPVHWQEFSTHPWSAGHPIQKFPSDYGCC